MEVKKIFLKKNIYIKRKTVKLIHQLFPTIFNDDEIFHLISKIESNNFGMFQKNNQCYGRGMFQLIIK